MDVSNASPRKIVVFTDFSGSSHSALEQGSRLAAGLSLHLHVVHIVDALVVEDLAEVLDRKVSDLVGEVRADCLKRLDDILKRTSMTVPTTSEVRVGRVAEEILYCGSQPDVERVCLGVRGSAGAEWSGRLAKLCVRHLNVPVLLVRERNNTSFKTVLAGIDFSPTSMVAFQQAVLLARAEGARIVAVHAFVPPWTRLHYRAPTPEAEPKFIKQYTDTLHFRLKNFTSSCVDSLEGMDVQWELEKATSHGHGLISAAKRNKADMIVVGTQGRSRLLVRFFGSTADRVLHDADCSVLTVPPAE